MSADGPSDGRPSPFLGGSLPRRQRLPQANGLIAEAPDARHGQLPGLDLALGVALGATLLGAWLRLAIAPYFSFFGDETATLHWSLEPVGEILSNYGGGLSSHLYILLMKPWIGFFGSSPLAVKAPSLIAGVLIVPAVYWLGRRWLEPAVGSVAAVLAAMSLPLIRFSQVARVYSVLTMAALITMALFGRALTSRRWREPLLLGLANALLLMLSLNAVFVVAVQVATMVAFGVRMSGSARRSAARQLAGCALSAGLALLFYSRAFPDIRTFRQTWTGAAWRPELLLSTFRINHPLAPWALLLALLLLGAWSVARRGTANGIAIVLWAILPALLYVAARPRHIDGDIARFLVWTLPAHCLLLSAGLLAAIRALLPTIAEPGRLRVAVVVVAVLGLSNSQVRTQPFIERTPSNLAIDEILQLAGPGDVVTTFGYPPFEFLIDVQPGLESAPVSGLARDPGRSVAGTLIVLTPAIPEARARWSRSFRITEIGSLHYGRRLYLLTSDRMEPGPDAAVQPLIDLLEGFVTATAVGVRLHQVPYKHYLMLADAHQLVALLCRHLGDADRARRHDELAAESLRRGVTESGGLR